MELRTQVERAQSGDITAFTELTRRYRNLAFGYALAILHDFHLAQDAAQEAFIAAYCHLGSLHDADAFPLWLRGIVRHRCHRILRKRHFQELPLEHAAGLAAEGGEPERVVEGDGTQAAVLAAVAALPEEQREAITLYYLQEHSQREVAAFLGLPVSTVNNRLHAAHTRLKRRMVAMAQDTLKEQALPEEFAERIGKIVQVKGPVVEAQFAPDELPEIFSALTVTDEARGVAVTVEVAQRLRDGIVRGLASSPVPGLRRGMRIVDTGRAAPVAVSKPNLERAIRVLGRPDVVPPVARELLATGIKVIDLLCPYVKGGQIGLFGETGIGMLVLVEELVHRLAEGQEGEDCEVAQRVKHALHRFRELQGGEPEGAKWPDAIRLKLARARKLQRFFSQPFHVAEPFTKLAARHVSREETIHACRAILDGDCDDLPEPAFAYVGTLDEVREKARGLG